MFRLVHARKDLLTSFDLRAQIFRVNLEFSTCYHGQNNFSKKCPKVTFQLEKFFFRIFFLTVPFGPLMTDKISKHFFRAGKVLSQIFLKNVSISVAKMDMKRLRLDHGWSSTYQKIHRLLSDIFPNTIFDSFTIKMSRKFSRCYNEKIHIKEIIIDQTAKYSDTEFWITNFE